MKKNKKSYLVGDLRNVTPAKGGIAALATDCENFIIRHTIFDGGVRGGSSS